MVDYLVLTGRTTVGANTLLSIITGNGDKYKMKQYFKYMLDRGVIEQHGGTHLGPSLRITAKGYHIIEKYEEAIEQLIERYRRPGKAVNNWREIRERAEQQELNSAK